MWEEYMNKVWRNLTLSLIGGLGLVIILLATFYGMGRSVNAADQPLYFVDQYGQPLSPTVRVLCYTTVSTTSPITDLLVETNALGRPVEPLPSNCNYVAALYLHHEQPSGKPDHGPAYQSYATSWSPGSRELVPITGPVTISSDWPLILFNVVASLEWEPAPDSDFVAELFEGLYQTSTYLYNLTEGQMALGSITVHTGGHHWNGADMRFLAANDYRPGAFIGGIVSDTIPYTASTGIETVFAPGAIYLGRYWDGEDAFDSEAGKWSAPNAYMTLGHEWAHYALFLYDEYQDSDVDGGGSLYCTCPGLPEEECDASAMAYHYTASELWHADIHGTPPACLRTDQWYVHGESDWDTLAHWSSIQSLNPEWLQKPDTLNTGLDLGLAGNLFGGLPGYQYYFPFVSASTPKVDNVTPFVVGSTEPTIKLVIGAALEDERLNAFYPQVYLVDQETPDSPARILYQGSTSGVRNALEGRSVLGSITLFSVNSRSRVQAFADRYSTQNSSGGRFIYLPGHDSPPIQGDSLTLVTDPWPASLDVHYDMVGDRLVTMTLELVTPHPLTDTPVARLCVPDSAVGCSTSADWQKPLQAISSTTWSTTFVASPGEELPPYSLLQVTGPDQSQIIRWVQQVGGAGLGHRHAHAPFRDGSIMLDLAETVPLEGERNRVIIMPAANYQALIAPLPISITTLVDVPLDIDILLPGLDANPRNILLTMFHRDREDQAVPAPVGGCEPQVLRFNRQTSQWSIIAAAGSSDQLNWSAATGQVDQGGIYAVGLLDASCAQP
jgi:hypothetical protein